MILCPLGADVRWILLLRLRCQSPVVLVNLFACLFWRSASGSTIISSSEGGVGSAEKASDAGKATTVNGDGGVVDKGGFAIGRYFF